MMMQFIAFEMYIGIMSTKTFSLKDSLPLDKDNEKFLSVRGTTHLLVHDVALEDAGYYRCVLTFAHEGQQYNITRTVELRIKSKYLPLRHPSILVQ